jgi:hypothetical protein
VICLPIADRSKARPGEIPGLARDLPLGIAYAFCHKVDGQTSRATKWQPDA